MIATLNYSSWYGKHVGHPMKVKAEPSIKKETIPAKRSVNNPVGPIKNKKAKIDKNSINENTIEENTIAKNSIAAIDPPVLASPIILKNSLSQVFTATKPIAKITAPSSFTTTTTSPGTTPASAASGPSTAMTTPITPSTSTTSTMEATSDATNANFNTASVNPLPKQAAPSKSAIAKPSKKAKAGNALNAK
ncbi:hypothetical protein C0991_009535 [Blastosporella zonata]|nr:hypothetical protein C0991_009535 [Blastosporella zonata]